MITRKIILSSLVSIGFVLGGCNSGGADATESTSDTVATDAMEEEQTTASDEAPTMETVEPLDNVSDQELKQFFEAATAVQVYMQTVQPRMFGHVQKAGFDPNRYAQLVQAEEAGTAVEMTPEEEAKFEKLSAKMDQMQENANDTMQLKIEASGLSKEHYQAIMATVRQDTTLQRKLNDMQAELMASGNVTQP